MTSRDRAILEAVTSRPGDWSEVQAEYTAKTGRKLSSEACMSALVRLRRASLIEILPRNRQRPTYRAVVP